jgi:hypothetical protein
MKATTRHVPRAAENANYLKSVAQHAPGERLGRRDDPGGPSARRVRQPPLAPEWPKTTPLHFSTTSAMAPTCGPRAPVPEWPASRVLMLPLLTPSSYLFVGYLERGAEGRWVVWADQLSGPFPAASPPPIDLGRTGTFALIPPDTLRDHGLSDTIVGQLSKGFSRNGREGRIRTRQRRASRRRRPTCGDRREGDADVDERAHFGHSCSGRRRLGAERRLFVCGMKVAREPLRRRICSPNPHRSQVHLSLTAVCPSFDRILDCVPQLPDGIRNRLGR